MHRAFIPGLVALLSSAAPLTAEEAPRLGLELVEADPQDGACRLSFLAQNGMGGDLSALVFEAVIFDRDGGVDRLLLLDFRDLPAGKPRLRQFDLPGAECGRLGQVLINGAETCDGAGATPAACIGALVPSSRVAGMEVTG